jgi:hypothetical protein
MHVNVDVGEVDNNVGAVKKTPAPVEKVASSLKRPLGPEECSAPFLPRCPRFSTGEHESRRGLQAIQKRPARRFGRPARGQPVFVLYIIVFAM